MAKSNAERQADFRKRLKALRIDDHELQMLLFAAYYRGRSDEIDRKPEGEVSHEYVYSVAMEDFAANNFGR